MKRKLETGSENSSEKKEKRNVQRRTVNGRVRRKFVRFVENRKSFYVYLSLAALRIVLTILPQTGYIHPDEYFQSIEVIAGESFDVDYIRPWEFNHTAPLRSIAVPLLTVAFPYKIFKIIDFNLRSFLQISIQPSPYLLLILPRLVFCLCSFIVDFCLYKISKVSNIPCARKLTFLASSYVMLVYGTHTFSNTIEMILLSLLLYFVADSQQFSNEVISQYEFLEGKYQRARIAIERAKLYKLKILLPSHTTRNCIALSLITVTGFFNRPTFLLFAVVPIFFWIHRGLGCKSVSFAHFHMRMFVFIMYSFLAVIFYILVDSFYYGHLSVMEIVQLDISLKSFVFTPWNFIQYNLNAQNLESHGLHSRWLHVLVNVPLLFNVAGIATICGVVVVVYRLMRGQYTKLPHIHSIEALMLLTIIVPLVGLSYFPHQEPRFLLPLVLPVVYLHSDFIASTRPLHKLWITFNVLSLMFYGFVHQAGVYRAVNYFNKKVTLAQTTGQPIHLVTSHVYSIPLSLVQQPSTKRLYTSGTSRYRRPSMFFLQEMGSNDVENVSKHLSVISKIARSNIRQAEVYVLAPTARDLRESAEKYNVTLRRVWRFFPHLSTEAMPDFVAAFGEFSQNYDLVSLLFTLLQSCGLGLYSIEK